MTFSVNFSNFPLFYDLDFGSKRGSTRMPVNHAFSIRFQLNLVFGLSIHIKFGGMKKNSKKMFFGPKLKGGAFKAFPRGLEVRF